jgi:hypothetical protein
MSPTPPQARRNSMVDMLRQERDQRENTIPGSLKRYRQLSDMTLVELRKRAKGKVPGASKMKKETLVSKLIEYRFYRSR